MASRAFTIRVEGDDGTVTTVRGLEFIWTAANGAMPRGLMGLPVERMLA